MDVRTDLYPSRDRAEPRVLRRQDPVLYSSPGASVALSKGDAEAYERDGFLVRPSFFDDEELSAFRNEAERLRQDAGIRGEENAITEPGSGALRSIFKVHAVSPVFRRLAADRRLVELAETILGDRAYIHQSRLNYKPSFAGKEFYWHSDFETWHVEDGMPRMRALSVSISLTDNTAINGPLMLVPGSHRHYVSCVGETPAQHYKVSLKKQEYGVPDDDSLRRLIAAGGIVTVTGPAGTMAIFDCNTMHGSNGNITPDQRINVFLVYNAVSNRLGPPFGAETPRPGYIAERERIRPL